MAVIIVFDIPGGTRAQYEEVTDKMTGGRGVVRSRSDWPVPGLISHCAGPTPDGWHVTDVWESKEAFQRFVEKIAPLMREAGMPETEPKIYEASNVVTS
ncbi:hypothetical protein BX285_6715 [Streptomyces sp. 1114.5]|uniref:hypothetical protein n=1 Tax=unclassified Streptomyces TaxID=2593676 RepID=UPI000BC63D7A|nr:MULTISPECIES: hypothetical protein [unclassified Streptomyces]RKT09620.1 hypothetical protein BX285_6715 [Streptomyces sp. 1114.5]SOB89061.1 hypothetical protein SAMN06272789_7395 [Streptomyces sp. 1331.2]